MRKLTGIVLMAALALSACEDEAPDAGFEALPSESATVAAPSPGASAGASSTEVDVTTTPDEITPEWVTAVVNTLLAEYGEMTAEILAMPVTDDPTLPQGFEERLEELFAGEYLEFARSEARALLVDADERRSQLLPSEQFRGIRFEVHIVQVAESECIVAVGRTDRSASIPAGSQSEVLAAASLSPRTALEAERPEWLLRDLLVNTDSDGKPHADDVMFDASLGDYGGALDQTCAGGP